MVKRFMDKSVKRIEVEEDRMRGTLFIPKGAGPFPRILDFSGIGGGINEQKAFLKQIQFRNHFLGGGTG